MPILSLTDYKARAGVTGTSRDAQLTAALAAAEDTVNRECGRNFSADPVTESRIFPYSGTGILQTDDFTTLLSVTINGGLLGLSYCLPGPPPSVPGDPYFFIRVTGRGPSPAMGFMWNADVLASEGRNAVGNAEVEAVWGWTEVPESVKQAVTWLTTEFAADQGDGGGKDLASESQGEVTYVYDRTGDESTSKSQPELPPRIRQLLHPFVRTRF